MKNTTLSVLLFFFGSSWAFGQPVVGHLINNVPTVTLNVSNVQTAFTTHFSQYDASTSVTIDSIRIEDDVNDTMDLVSIIYYYRLTISTQSEALSVSTRYPLIYNSTTSEYELDVDANEIDGGKFSCKRSNCNGCHPKKEGGLRVCSHCTPLSENSNYSCEPVFGPTNTGNGWGPILTGIGAIIAGIGTLLGNI